MMQTPPPVPPHAVVSPPGSIILVKVYNAMFPLTLDVLFQVCVCVRACVYRRTSHMHKIRVCGRVRTQLCVCVCVCVCARAVRVCMRARLCVCAVEVHACWRAALSLTFSPTWRVHTHSRYNTHTDNQ